MPSCTSPAPISTRRLAAVLALVMIAVAVLAATSAGTADTSAQSAAPSAALASETRCSTWSASIPQLRYRACYVTLPSGGGVEMRTGLQVQNVTTTARWVQMYESSIVSGVIVGTTDCKRKVVPGLNAVANCWEPSNGTSYHLVRWGGYGYGHGTAIDLSSHEPDASTPVLRVAAR